MRKYFTLTLFAVGLALVGLGAPASMAQSKNYMSLENWPVYDQPANQDEDWIILQCGGYGDVGFLLMYGDAREWPKIYKNGCEKDFYTDVMTQAQGHFPGFGSKVVEFRYGVRGHPHSLIFRINSDNPNGGRRHSQLFVARIGDYAEDTCIIGVRRTNSEAAALADSPIYCR